MYTLSLKRSPLFNGISCLWAGHWYHVNLGVVRFICVLYVCRRCCCAVVVFFCFAFFFVLDRSSRSPIEFLADGPLCVYLCALVLHVPFFCFHQWNKYTSTIHTFWLCVQKLVCSIVCVWWKFLHSILVNSIWISVVYQVSEMKHPR